MQCKMYVVRTDKVNSTVHRCCAKKARVFLRVTYASVRKHYENGTSTDAFGFCLDCSRGMEDPKKWRYGWQAWPSDWLNGTVLKLRGEVSSVEFCTEKEASGERTAGAHADLKARIKVIMRQKNHEKIEPETWAEIFSDCVDEITVEAVQNA